MTFKRGFIAPPWPHVRGDSVSAISLIHRTSKNAGRSCGQHYEIYHYRVITGLADILNNLNTSDAATFQEIAVSQGFRLDESTRQGAYQAYQNMLYEIRREQE
ncbi:hypothetical protein [Cedecea sp.]|uniref:hypothetical protein n=1 Tax=Cedecea sp. TaxID=1970739 RepID=UPI002F3FAED3